MRLKAIYPKEDLVTGAIALEPMYRLLYNLGREPILFPLESISIGKELSDTVTPDRRVVFVDVVIQVAARGAGLIGVILLAANPAIGMEATVEVHARSAIMVTVGDQPAGVALPAQYLGHCQILGCERLPRAER